MEKDSALYQLMGVRMNGITNSDGQTGVWFYLCCLCIIDFPPAPHLPETGDA